MITKFTIFLLLLPTLIWYCVASEIRQLDDLWGQFLRYGRYQADEHGNRPTLTSNPKSLLPMLLGYQEKGTEHVNIKPRVTVRLPNNVNKRRYDQTFMDVPVWDTNVVASVDPNTDGLDFGHSIVAGQVVSGIYDDIKSVDNTRYKCENIIRIAEEQIETPYNPYELLESTSKKFIYFDPKDKKAKVVCYFTYLVRLFESLGRRCGLIDANTGFVLRKWNCLMTLGNYQVGGFGGNPNTKQYGYGKLNLMPLLNVTRGNNGRCTLENDYVKVTNYHNTENVEYREPAYEFACCEGIVKDEVNGGYGPLNDALFFGEITVKMLRDYYQINFPSNTRPTMGAHYGINVGNAFWSGSGVILSDGNTDYYPFTTLGIIAHELGHGITEVNSNLIYENQPGGINEAFSDMTAETTQFYFEGRADYVIGNHVKKNGQPLRYLYDPKKDGSSINSYSDYTAGMSPHYSSGLFNRAFYILATKYNWNIREAFGVFLRANQLYWNPTSSFIYAACGVMRAAKDLGRGVNDVQDAFFRVGITCNQNIEQLPTRS